MSLRSLYEKISEYSDFALIGRDFSAFDTDYSVLGFANSSDKTELVLLNFNCAEEDICCEDLTFRENIILEKKNQSDLSDDFSAIVIDGQRFDFSSVCGETLECCELTKSYIISEFMKLGWKSDRFLDAPLDSLFISFIELENKIVENDIVLPYVEYSCDDEISVIFCLFDELDKPFKGMGGLATDDGVVALAVDNSSESNLKSAVIYSPIEPNTKHIECCLVCCEKMLDKPAAEYRFSI